jgi:hypothetical protein
LTALENDAKRAKRLKAVRNTLGLMEGDPHAPKLHTYEYRSLQGAKGEKVFESYVETKAVAAAHRVFWHYGPLEEYITILAITAYP